ncbi:MAG: hypothetical protein KAX49_17265 [Halanaerobiales bacterium]|nr:hypothetical protein [Halanaerobiales bacterium]
MNYVKKILSISLLCLIVLGFSYSVKVTASNESVTDTTISISDPILANSPGHDDDLPE